MPLFHTPTYRGPGRWFATLLALSVLACLWFFSLDVRALIKPDEGRYAEIAREMALSGDFITPTLNGLKYFEKPPLQYWATALGFQAFGLHEWVARLWTALTGFAGIWLVWLTGSQLFGRRAGVLAAAVLMSCLLYNVIGHMNTLDMGFSFFLQLTISGFLLGVVMPAHSPLAAHRWRMAMWTGLGLAVLSKGIAALVLCGGTLMIFSLLTQDWKVWQRMNWGLGLPIFLLVTAPWFILVSLQNPEFPHFFFIHEHFERFLTSTHRRTQPGWYFIPVLLLGVVPWLSLLPHAVVRAWRNPQPTQPNVRKAVVFLSIWGLIVFTFFSISNSKLPSYILPLFPALALITGYGLTKISSRALAYHLAGLLILVIPALSLGNIIEQQVDIDYTVSMVTGFANWTRAGILSLLVCLFLALFALRSRHQHASILLTALGGFLCTTSVMIGHNYLSPFSSSQQLVKQLPPINRDAPFFSILTYDQTLPFYLQKTMTLVNFRDEMDFGLIQEPHKGLDTLDEFAEKWSSLSEAYALISTGEQELLRNKQILFEEIYRDSYRTIIRKPTSTTSP